MFKDEGTGKQHLLIKIWELYRNLEDAIIADQKKYEAIYFGENIRGDCIPDLGRVE